MPTSHDRRTPPPPHFVAHLDRADKALEGVKTASIRITKSSAIRAFRTVGKSSEEFHLPVPLMNRSGNLRGMVVSQRARAIFNVSTNVAEKFQKYDRALVVAGILIEVAKDIPRLKAVYDGRAPGWEKARMTTLILSAAVLRSASGIVPLATTILAKSLEGYCDLAYLASGNRFQAAESWKGKLNAVDVTVTAKHEEILQPEYLQWAGDRAFANVEAHIHFN